MQVIEPKKGLFIPAYLGDLYQPGNAVALGKSRVVVKGQRIPHNAHSNLEGTLGSIKAKSSRPP